MAAKDDFLEKKLTVITLSRREVVEIIALLTGQLANCPVPGNHSGAAPSIPIVENGQCVNRIALLLDREK